MSNEQKEKLPCAACGEPTENGADIDQGDGWKRTPVCDTECLNELLMRMGGGAGSQVRATFPAAGDL